jgi:cytochrome P450
MTIAEFDPFDPAVLADPYELYGQMRERSGVHFVPDMNLFLVSRYADVRDAASRKEDFSSHLTALVMASAATTKAVAAELVQLDSGVEAVDVLATADPPDHTRQRKTVARAFRDIAQSEAVMRALIDEMLAPMIDAGSCDLMDDFADWVPVRVVAEVLGLPQADAPMIKRGADSGVELLGGVTPPDRLAECITEIIEFSAYIEDHVANGTARAPGRLLGLLATCVDDGTITGPEATAIALQLVVAGSDSTGNLIGNAARLLGEHRQVQADLRADPTQIPAYLEEVLRLESPFRGHFRVATRDSTLGGTRIHAGATLFLMWGSANRDPAVFERPDQLVLHRPNANDHLGFGWGVHRCVGAPLARLEAKIALEQLLAATSLIEPTPGAVAPGYVPSMLVRRLSHLHLDFRPAE